MANWEHAEFSFCQPESKCKSQKHSTKHGATMIQKKTWLERCNWKKNERHSSQAINLGQNGYPKHPNRKKAY